MIFNAQQIVILTYLSSIVTSGARSTTGSNWASAARSTTLTRETSVTLKDRRDTLDMAILARHKRDAAYHNVVFWRCRGYSLLVQMGHGVQPHQEHPKEEKERGEGYNVCYRCALKQSPPRYGNGLGCSDITVLSHCT